MTTSKQAIAMAKRIVDMRHKIQEVQSDFDEWFIKRYDVHYSDVDCDQLIDALNQGTGVAPQSIKQLDAWMWEECKIKPAESPRHD